MARVGAAVAVLALLASPLLAAAMAPALAPGPALDGAGNDCAPVGSGNIDDPCFSDPSAPACATFERSDADWSDDLAQLCSATPYAVGCWLWHLCKTGAAAGTYCALSSLTANVCVDAPLINATATPGCEAWVALCGAQGSVVAQCTAPGPLPDIVNTLTARDGINSLCSTHFMDGCRECTPNDGPGVHDFVDCAVPGPLPILAHQCYAMPGMGECSQTGIQAMCSGAEAQATFPTVCVEPLNPTTLPPALPVSACDGGSAPPPGAPQPAAALVPAPAGAPQPLAAPPSAAWPRGGAGARLAAAALLAVAVLLA